MKPYSAYKPVRRSPDFCWDEGEDSGIEWVLSERLKSEKLVLDCVRNSKRGQKSDYVYNKYLRICRRYFN